jgi:hypothetical protein
MDSSSFWWSCVFHLFSMEAAIGRQTNPPHSRAHPRTRNERARNKIECANEVELSSNVDVFQ